jgi:hypothetical protein
MPNTKNTNTKPKTPKAKTTSVVSVPNVINSEQKKESRPGRTILLKATSNTPIDQSIFTTLDGLQSNFETKNSNSYFLTFDSVENAENAFNNLSSTADNYNVKYSYYRIFFTIEGLTDSSNYDEVKQQMIDYILSKTSSSVLYCKFYRKDKNYLGCGDLTIDTMEGMNLLLAKENNNKDFAFGDLSGTFYRYNNKKGKPLNASA